MAYTLIGEKTFYKEVVVQLPPYWDNGIMVDQPPTITYEPFSGWDEPFDAGDAEILPAGVKSSDSRWLFTTENLHVHTSFETSSYESDKIYLSNPEEGRVKPQAYVIAKAEDWTITDSFTLLDSSKDYVIVREDRITA